MYRWRLAALFFLYPFLISWYLLLSYSPEVPQGWGEGDEDMKFPTSDDMTIWEDEYLADDYHCMLRSETRIL